MASTVETTYRYKGFINRTYHSRSLPDCVYADNLWAWMGQRQKTLPVEEHRIRPPVLWKSPTSCGQYYTYETGHVVRKKEISLVCRHTGKLDTFWTYYVTYVYPKPWDPLSSNYPWSNILAGKVKDLRVNLASDMAEYKEGLNAASGLAKDLTHAVRKAKELWALRRDPTKVFRYVWAGTGSRMVANKAARTLVRDRRYRKWDDIPATWLGVNLATLPALGTLSDVVDKLNNPNNTRPLYRVIRFGHTEPGSDQEFEYGVVARHVKVRKRTKVLCVVELENENLWRDDFTPGNPGEWLWEMIPLSFVLDWFIPVGNYLSALDAYSGIKGTWGTMTFRVEVAAIGLDVPEVGYRLEEPGYLAYKSYQRTAIYGPPALTPPKWRPNPSWRKLVTAMSLLTLRMRQPGPRKGPDYGKFFRERF